MAEVGTVRMSPSMRTVSLRVVIPHSFKFRIWLGSLLVRLAANVLGCRCRIEIE